MMRTVSIFITILLLLSACKKDEHKFTLTGHVKGINEGELLIIIPDTAYSRIDTVRIRQEQFTYELQTDTTVQLTLLFPGERLCTVFADKQTRTELTADTAHWGALTLKGGIENNALQQFLDSTRNMTAAQIKSAVTEYIRRHPFSPAGVHLLNTYYAQTDTPDYNGIEANIKLMSGKLQDNYIVQDLQKQLEDIIKADTGKYISNFRIKNKHDKFINAYQFSGKYLVITFWASWQPEGLKLQKEILKQKEARDKRKEKVSFINVALDTDKNIWNELQKDSLPDEQTCDFQGWEGDMVSKFGITDLPQMILLSPQRRVALRSADLNAIMAKLDTLMLKDKEREKLKKK